MTSSATRLWREDEDDEDEEEEEEEEALGGGGGGGGAHDSISLVVGTWPHESPSAGTSTDAGDGGPRFWSPPRRNGVTRSSGATGRVVTWLVSSTARPRSRASWDSEAASEARARARRAVWAAEEGEGEEEEEKEVVAVADGREGE